MTNLVSAKDDVNLRVSTCLSAAIDEGRRRRCYSMRAIRLFVLQTAIKNVYTDNHSGFSARQRDSNVSVTDLVSAKDDVNLRVSTCLSAAIDEGRRRRR